MFNFIAQVLTIWVVISPYEIHEHINMEVAFIFFGTYVCYPLIDAFLLSCSTTSCTSRV